MKVTRIRLMELAGLVKEARSFEELMDMGKGLKSFTKISDTEFALKHTFLGKPTVWRVTPITGNPNRLMVKRSDGSSSEMSPSQVYNTIYNAKLNADFENQKLGNKTKKPTTAVKGIKVRDDEGEAVTTLTDISSATELMKRIEKEPEDYKLVWAEIPFAFDVVGPDSEYNTTEDDVADLEHYPPTTYDKWIKGYRDYAEDVLSSD